MKIKALVIICNVTFSNQNNENEKSKDQDDCVESCNENVRYEQLGGHCYFWSYHKETWRDAEEKCKEKKKGKEGHLAAVTGKEIHDLLMKRVVDEVESSWYWIG